MSKGVDFDLGEEGPDLYEVLGAERSATEDELRRAYRKRALQAHPDKWAHLDTASAEAQAKTREFQQISFAYTILKDAKKRACYDKTGSTDGLLDVVEEGKDWNAYFRELWSGVVDATTIEKLAKTYKGSAEEKADILAAYNQHQGDIDMILTEVMLAEVDDEPRIVAVIEAAIKDKTIKRTKAFTRTKKGAKKRRSAADSEAAEAAELRKELGLDDQLRRVKRARDSDDEHAQIQALVRQRTSSRMNAVIANIEEKYAQKQPARKKGKKSKASAAAAFSEPSEEEFQALQAKMFGKK